MGFTQSCFIRKNTPRLRKKLEELGYTNGAWESPHFEYPYLKCFPNRKFGLFNGEGFYITEDDYKCDGKQWTYNPPKEYIDCGTNEELFLALSALRDDSDYMQWFTDGKLWEKSNNDLPSHYMQLEGHKATTKELIEHFKSK